MPHYLDLPVNVLHVDGLHLRRSAVILISSNEAGEPVGWYLARSEHSHAWRALLNQSQRPFMVVTDGGAGFRKALAAKWPGMRVQRCLFHVYGNITALTSKTPKLAAGRELKDLAWRLLHVKTIEESKLWEQLYWGVSRFLDRVYSLCDLSHNIGCGLRFPYLARGLVSQG